MMKKSTQFLPVIGWSMWFSEYVFLARNWTVDEQTLKVRVHEYQLLFSSYDGGGDLIP